MKQVLVQKDSYFDSVFLMLINQDVKKTEGVTEAVVAMATEVNVELLGEIGLSSDEVVAATPNDLIIAVEGESKEAITEAIDTARALLSKKSGTSEDRAYQPTSLDAAIKGDPEANMVLISLPGEYAAREVRKALSNDLHVMLFSDNVSLEDEISLKKLARDRGLLMMGPDCGTAIINGKPLCFANVVRRGEIGLVAASGTGLQEVTCSIDKLGAGVSQAIGTGGRDLKSVEVGGMMMLAGIEALAHDAATKVITVVSKPPATEVADRVIKALKDTGKPCVVHFIGLGPRQAEGLVSFADNLEEAAGMSVALARGESYQPQVFTIPEDRVAQIVAEETQAMSSDQRFLRGFYTGGTLADEAMILLTEALGGVFSFESPDPAYVLVDPHRSQDHTIVDLGEDVFTVGRPHPMIDPSTRTERIEKEREDASVAVILLDCVLGYGSHADPAGAMVPAIAQAKEAALARGGYLSVVASVTGTSRDPQSIDAQRATLESAGVIVMPSNYQAAMLALHIMKKVGSR